MKKVISIVLCIVMIFSISIPAFAGIDTGLNHTSTTPVIYISGDGNQLAYDNDTKLFAIRDMLKIYSNSDDGNITEAAKNILYPLIVKGFLNDDWDDYYAAVYKELSDVYDPILLDNNGDVRTDCGIPSWQKADIDAAMVQNRVNADGTYSEKSYMFYYDWRLDPIEIADDLHEYIEGVKQATGHDKVELSVRCLGSNNVLAYIDKYGTDSLKGVGIDVSTSMGADFLSGMISGKFGIDGNAISRFITDYATREEMSMDIFNFASATIDLMTNTGVIGKLTDLAKEALYSKIEYGIVSALALSTFLTFPGYWAVVSVEDFDSAIRYVFGDENDPKREEYAGLINKITYYNEHIKKNVYPIMQTLEDDGVNVCIISKYGTALVPFIKDNDVLGDEYVAVSKSSFGATASNIYNTLSDKYIKAQTDVGLGKYISPDKKIDASTCLFPDYTWFVKGVGHADYTVEEVSLMLTVIDADRQMTINDFDFGQFLCLDHSTNEVVMMTKDNCNNEVYTANDKIDHPKTKNERLTSFLVSLFKWIKAFFNLAKSALTK